MKSSEKRLPHPSNVQSGKAEFLSNNMSHMWKMLCRGKTCANMELTAVDLRRLLEQGVMTKRAMLDMASEFRAVG